MNIRIIYFFLLALLLTACESQSEKLQKMAKENIQTAMHDIAKDSSPWKSRILKRAFRLTAFVS